MPGGDGRAFQQFFIVQLGVSGQFFLQVCPDMLIPRQGKVLQDLLLPEPQLLGQQVVDLRFGLHLAGRRQHPWLELHVGVPVGSDDVRLLEHVLGRQDDVGLQCGVGHELVHHHPEFQLAECLQDGVGVGVLGHGIAPFHPDHLQLRVTGLQHVGPQLRHGDRPPEKGVGPDLGIIAHRLLHRVEDVALEVGIMEAGARLPDIAGDDVEGKQGPDGLPAVREPLHAIARRQGHGVHRTDVMGQLLQEFNGDIGDLRRPSWGELPDAVLEFLIPQDMVVDELPVGQALADEEVGDAEGEGGICSGPGLHQQVGAFGGLGPPGVDHHQFGALLLRLFDEDHLLDVGLGGVLPPQDDQLRVFDVPGGVVLVVAQRQPDGFQARRPAQVAVHGGGPAEKLPEPAAEPVHESRHAAARIEQDAPGPELLFQLSHPPRYRFQGRIPGDPFKPSGRGPLQGMQYPVLRMGPLHVAEPLDAHPFRGGPVAGVGVDVDDPASLHVYLEAAGAVTIPGAGSGVDRHGFRFKCELKIQIPPNFGM